MYRKSIALCVFAGLSTLAFAGVDPEITTAVLAPGESTTVTKTVTLPEDTPKLDLVLLVDLSGSYYDDLPNIKSLAEPLANAIRASVPDSQFALATFIDFPLGVWGSPGDYAYQLDQDLTADIDTWNTAVQGMDLGSGDDWPESQYEGLFQAVTGLGNDVNGDGDYDDTSTGDIAQYLDVSFRADATRVIAITTDAPFRDSDSELTYPGAGGDATLAAVLGAGVKIVAIQAPEWDAYYNPTLTAQMEELTDATGGAHLTTSATSAELATAVLAGLEALTYTVSAEADDACVLDLSWTPDEHEDVEGGASVSFVESIGVPVDIDEDDLEPGGYATCSVSFFADDTVIGTESIEVLVPLAPVALCADATVSADDDCLGWADIEAGSYDPNGGALTYDYSDDGPWGPGAHEVTLTVTDEDGETDSCTATVTVVDNTGPVVSVGEAVELWPPNHRYVGLDLVECGVTATDACDGAIDVLDASLVTAAWSDEAEDAKGGGDGTTLRDIALVGDASFNLRAERMGAGNGRVYGVAFEVYDAEGNLSEAECAVTVPHSADGVAAVDDGPFYVVH